MRAGQTCYNCISDFWSASLQRGHASAARLALDPNDLPLFAQNLCEWLDTRDSRYVTLVEFGYVKDRGKSCFASDNHIDRYSNGLIAKGSFQKPTNIKPVDFTALPVTATISMAARILSSP